MRTTKKALVIGAHPDDCALGAAGFSVLLRRSGWEVTFLTMTDGQLGGDPALRVNEELACARILGVRLELGHLMDGAMDGPKAVAILEQKLAEDAPDLILTHAPSDSHGDHRVLSESVLSAARRHASVLFFEGPSTQSFLPAMRIDISQAWELKTRSLLAHDSQTERVRTVEWAEAAGRHRAWPHYRGICEAFMPVRINLDLMCGTEAQDRLPRTAVPAANVADRLARSGMTNDPAPWRML
jgi:LmbE family N-acetylglucosaminyl deacetylase